jgi:hypothetical protein
VPASNDVHTGEPGLSAIVELFTRACTSFSQALVRSDYIADEVDFTGSIHQLGFDAGRVSALGQVLSIMTGNPAWTARADEVLAEYMAATLLPEEAN